MSSKGQQHTPGPWELVIGAGSEGYAGNYEIMSAMEPEHEANAALIAAAPELLEMFNEPEQEHPELYVLGLIDTAAILLQRCAGEAGLSVAQQLMAFRRKAIAAITKAKGTP